MVLIQLTTSVGLPLSTLIDSIENITATGACQMTDRIAAQRQEGVPRVEMAWSSHT